MTKNFPPNIPYCLNRVTNCERERLRLTCDHFNIRQNERSVLSEALLRFGLYVNNTTIFHIPTDPIGKMLCRIYKYYDSLSLAG